jgi:hypothetical protein
LNKNEYRFKEIGLKYIEIKLYLFFFVNTTGSNPNNEDQHIRRRLIWHSTPGKTTHDTIGDRTTNEEIG